MQQIQKRGNGYSGLGIHAPEPGAGRTTPATQKSKNKAPTRIDRCASGAWIPIRDNNLRNISNVRQQYFSRDIYVL